ncbi:MAG: prealbumin-like fold domain-containing protein [Oscillospiraceae bacterium]|jgi:uncharacterized surface anchored protein|nr:prealbumin-like fold domain-containing protein [Oscillospiraceae bacterium]
MLQRNQSQPQTLAFTVINAETGIGIRNARFDLYKDNRRISSSQSDADGRVTFGSLAAGAYRLIQTTFPEQLRGLSVQYDIRLDNHGVVRLGGEVVRAMRVLNFPKRVKA